MHYTLIHPADLIRPLPLDACIVDVRTAAEARAESLANSIHIPLHQLSAERLQAELARGGKQVSQIYLLCQAGRRAEMAAEQLNGKLDIELYVVAGGINALKQAQIPIQRTGGAVMSLERQVRIAAGMLVLVGVVLGSMVDATFYLVCGFVGAGLIFAGITDTCMMGMLIARMPWNNK